MSDGTQKLWGGRFTGETDPLMHLYNASLPYDYKMYKADLEGTKDIHRRACRSWVF